jgi:hypothetical protein
MSTKLLLCGCRRPNVMQRFEQVDGFLADLKRQIAEQDALWQRHQAMLLALDDVLFQIAELPHVDMRSVLPEHAAIVG